MTKLKIKIIALGKIKEKFIKSGIDEFLKRLNPFTQVEIIEINPIEVKDINIKDNVLLQDPQRPLNRSGRPCVEPGNP